MVFKNAGFRVLLHSSRIPISWEWGRDTRNLHFSKHFSLTLLLSLQITDSNYGSVGGASGASRTESSARRDRTCCDICQLPRPPHARRQYTHSARVRVGAGSHSPLAGLPVRLGTCEQNRCVRPGPAKRASKARARSLPPRPCRGT